MVQATKSREWAQVLRNYYNDFDQFVIDTNAVDIRGESIPWVPGHRSQGTPPPWGSNWDWYPTDHRWKLGYGFNIVNGTKNSAAGSTSNQVFALWYSSKKCWEGRGEKFRIFRRFDTVADAERWIGSSDPDAPKMPYDEAPLLFDCDTLGNDKYRCSDPFGEGCVGTVERERYVFCCLHCGSDFSTIDPYDTTITRHTDPDTGRPILESQTIIDWRQKYHRSADDSKDDVLDKINTMVDELETRLVTRVSSTLTSSDFTDSWKDAIPGTLWQQRDIERTSLKTLTKLKGKELKQKLDELFTDDDYRIPAIVRKKAIDEGLTGDAIDKEVIKNIKHYNNAIRLGHKRFIGGWRNKVAMAWGVLVLKNGFERAGYTRSSDFPPEWTNKTFTDGLKIGTNPNLTIYPLPQLSNEFFAGSYKDALIQGMYNNNDAIGYDPIDPTASEKARRLMLQTVEFIRHWHAHYVHLPFEWIDDYA